MSSWSCIYSHGLVAHMHVGEYIENIDHIMLETRGNMLITVKLQLLFLI